MKCENRDGGEGRRERMRGVNKDGERGVKYENKDDGERGREW